MSEQYEPADNDKRDILPHLRYEIHFVIFPEAREEKHLDKLDSLWLSYMVHARLLFDFFELTRKTKADDVSCSDFGFHPSSIDISDEDRIRFNKDMMHLTYSRLRHDQESKPWPIDKIYPALKARCMEFAQYICKDYKNIEPDELLRWKKLEANIYTPYFN